MALKQPFNLRKWVEDNRELLKPPVGNQQLYQANDDFIVMVVGGPNARKDFHYNEGEELFYQLEGDINLKIHEEGQIKDIEIKEGDIFLLPPRVPHSPRRPADTIGLVIEKHRDQNETDGFFWYCENCGHKLHETWFSLKDIVEQLPKEMENFYSNERLRTCTKCGTIMQPPK